MTMNAQSKVLNHLQLRRLAAMVLLSFAAGCTLVPPPQPEFEDISLRVFDSPSVEVGSSWLERDPQGEVIVAGFVTRQHGVRDTTHVHIDVVGFDSAGREVLQTKGVFTPEQIPWRKPPRKGVSRYRIALDDYSADVARIEIRAHEGPCPLTVVGAPIPENV